MVNGGGSGLSLVVAGYNLGEHLYGQDDYFLSYLQPSPPGQPSVIDLRNVRFVDPLGLVGIATLAQSQRQAGRDVTLDGPKDSNVAAYLSRMRLNDVLDYLGVGQDLPEVKGRARNTLLELQVFEGERQLERLAELIFDEFAPANRDLADNLYASVVELGTNVPQHSGLPSGFIAVQLYEDHAIFAIGDAGMGFLGTLPAAYSELMAVEWALRGKSSTGQIGRGLGLPFVRDFVQGCGGRLRIVTGRLSAVLQLGQPPQHQQLQHQLFDLGLPGGVLLQMRVPR